MTVPVAISIKRKCEALLDHYPTLGVPKQRGKWMDMVRRSEKVLASFHVHTRDMNTSADITTENSGPLD